MSNKLSLNGSFNGHTGSATGYCGINSGRKIPFQGKPAIQHPIIGSVYEIAEFSQKLSSIKRPAILIGYYMHEGVTIACDFLCPSSSSINRDPRYDNTRYDIFIPNHNFTGFSRRDLVISGTSTLTLSNNPDEILKPFPIDKIDASLLADYLLRRYLIVYEQKARWKKDALIPEGAVRHGMALGKIDVKSCAHKDRYLPDVYNPEHPFDHALTGPRFIADRLQIIRTWAETAVNIKRTTGISVPLPPLKTFPDWACPKSFLTRRNDQLSYMQSLNRD